MAQTVGVVPAPSTRPRATDRRGVAIGRSTGANRSKVIPRLWNESIIRWIDHGSMQEDGMKVIFACAVLVCALAGAPNGAEAKGCIKGAVVGGAAGHFAHHHGAIGAAAGCAIGHHEASKKSKTNQQQ
jgi:hypothetical protein